MWTYTLPQPFVCQTFEYIVQYIYIVQVPAHSSGYGNVYVQAGAGPPAGSQGHDWSFTKGLVQKKHSVHDYT